MQTNVASLNAQRNLLKSEKLLSTAMSRLSSGLRINMAADDAAGLAISEKLRADVRGLAQAQRNANDGISLLQTAESGLNQIGDMLLRMRELAVQSANGTLGSAERGALNDEFSELKSEIDRIANTTEFGGKFLLDGSQSGGINFQVGINNSANDKVSIALATATASAISVGGASIGVSTVSKASLAMDRLDSAIDHISDRRGDIGAKQNRLYVTISNLAAMHENISAANSRIRDADVATESANFLKGQILMQSGLSVLSQANQLPSMAMSLLG
jgi:flagellin